MCVFSGFDSFLPFHPRLLLLFFPDRETWPHSQTFGPSQSLLKTLGRGGRWVVTCRIGATNHPAIVGLWAEIQHGGFILMSVRGDDFPLVLKNRWRDSPEWSTRGDTSDCVQVGSLEGFYMISTSGCFVELRRPRGELVLASRSHFSFF